MNVVGVMDWQGGQLVWARGGERSRYAPLGLAPLELAQHWQQRYGVRCFYFADLDAIAGQEPAWAIYEQLPQAGFELWVDAGLRSASDRARHHGPWRVIVGLETLREWQAMRPGDLFSLDLRAGQPLGLGGDDPLALVTRAVEIGIREVILLDLARVGSGQGCGTATLGESLGRRFPEVRFYAGGGIRHQTEAQQLLKSGFHGVLVGSALHEGSWEDSAD